MRSQTLSRFSRRQSADFGEAERPPRHRFKGDDNNDNEKKGGKVERSEARGEVEEGRAGARSIPETFLLDCHSRIPVHCNYDTLITCCQTPKLTRKPGNR